MSATTENQHSLHAHLHGACCQSSLGSIPKQPNANASADKASAAPLKDTASLSPGTFLGQVVADHDLRSDGQALILFNDEHQTTQRMMASIAAGIFVSPGDKVLFVIPVNTQTAVITTVLARPPKSVASNTNQQNGLQKTTAAPAAQVSEKNQLVIRESEELQVTTVAGQKLVAIEIGACGPIVRLGQGALELDVPGELHLVADSMSFSSRQGPVKIQSSSDDVVVQGRTIRLN